MDEFREQIWEPIEFFLKKHGLEDQIDIITALAGGKYLTGKYAAIAPGGQQGDGQTSIVYDAATGEVRWRWRSPFARSTQIAVGDQLVLLGERGRLGTCRNPMGISRSCRAARLRARYKAWLQA